jgi:hypothetical protein
MEQVQIQTELLKAGVLTIDDVRSMRGLPPLVALNQLPSAAEVA